MNPRKPAAASRFRRTNLRNEYQRLAGSRLTIIAGGGVDEELLRLLAQRQIMREIHVGRAAREGQRLDGAVSAAAVRRLRTLLDSAD